jgi:hypothetical protein
MLWFKLVAVELVCQSTYQFFDRLTRQIYHRYCSQKCSYGNIRISFEKIKHCRRITLEERSDESTKSEQMPDISYSEPSSIPAKPPSIYFGGCSFGSAFYVGVHRAFVEMWGEDYYQHTIISGGSAGTVMAVGIALGMTPEYLGNLYATVAEKCRGKTPIYNGSKFLEDEIRIMVNKDPMSYKKIEGRCCFGTTAFFSKHRWHVSWESNEDLIQTIICSFHIPFYCKNVQLIHGELLIDGAYGFAGVDLIHDDETLFVGIDPHAEITRTFTQKEMVSSVYPAAGTPLMTCLLSLLVLSKR